MSEVIKWADLTLPQRNALVHEKVMNELVICYGTLEAADDFSYYECPACDATLSKEEVLSIECYAPHRRGDIPHYASLLNAAWHIVERFDHFLIAQYVSGRCHCELWKKAIAFTAEEATPEDAICLAALRAAGIEVE